MLLPLLYSAADQLLLNKLGKSEQKPIFGLTPQGPFKCPPALEKSGDDPEGIFAFREAYLTTLINM